ncbi:MAG TPA: TRAP transporter substrate-binding protein [Thermodesulfobacteriota bacterium]|nr:TRAP transporter substrate-binding protein [Thermodesulfobacteriota bacterium]
MRSHQWIRVASLLVLAGFFLFITGWSGAEAQVIQMKLGHFAADSHPGNVASKMLAEAVEKRTNGAIKIIIYPNNALGSPPEVLEQNILGAVDMSLPTQGQLGKYSKKFNCVMLPFMYTNYEHADKVLDGKFITWAAPDLDKAGLVFLSNWEWGFRNLTNNKRPVIHPADVKGLKVRTPPELPTQAAMEALGAVVATINFNELQMALKTGVVDGQENPIAVIYSNKIYESQKYLAMTGHNYNTMVHVISKKVWDKLTPAQQAIVKEESKKAGDWMRNTIRTEEADQINQLKKFGMEITLPDKSEFKKLMNPAYDRMKAIAGEENITAFIKMVDEAK